MAGSVLPVLPDWNWSYNAVELLCETMPCSTERQQVARPNLASGENPSTGNTDEEGYPLGAVPPPS